MKKLVFLTLVCTMVGGRVSAMEFGDDWVRRIRFAAYSTAGVFACYRTSQYFIQSQHASSYKALATSIAATIAFLSLTDATVRKSYDIITDEEDYE